MTSKFQDLQKRCDLLTQENEKYKSEDIFLLAKKQITITPKSKFWCFEDYPLVHWDLPPPSSLQSPLYSTACIPELEPRVKEFFFQGDKDPKIEITKVRFIKNIFLQKKFESNFIVMANQQHHIEGSPFNKRFPTTSAKEAVLNRFSKKLPKS